MWPVNYKGSHHIDCSNNGVNLGITDHWEKFVKPPLIAGWVKTILDWPHTKSVNFNGEYHQGGGGIWVRTGDMLDVKITKLGDNTHQDKWPSNKRHREISYSVDYVIHVTTIPVHGQDEGPQPLYRPDPAMLNTGHG
jgi:hypothetical protein